LPNDMMVYVILELAHTKFKNHISDLWAHIDTLVGNEKDTEAS